MPRTLVINLANEVRDHDTSSSWLPYPKRATLTTSVGSADPTTNEDEVEAAPVAENGASRSDDLERDFLRRLRRAWGGGGGEWPAVKTLF